MDRFLKRKQDVLGKLDKSSIGSWDKKILNLCDKMNELDDYYTTSSCAGRIVLIKDSERKGPGLFLWVSHDKITHKVLLGALDKIQYSGLVRFKQEPCILHVACRDLKSAEEMLRFAHLSGWKRSGIISSGKKFVVEMMGTDKLEFFVMDKGRVLVNDSYLMLVVKKSNENLDKSWEKINKLAELLR
jgi:tRNA wybutosine-synthesizing protein 3